MAGRWAIVGLLCLLAVASYLDRYILGVLAIPLAKGLALSDTQIGLLMGLGFGLVYSLIGLPLAHLIDSRSRVIIVFAGVMAWSLGTSLSAFAVNYPLLLASRAAVAIGEAVLAPAAVSLIADLFTPERRILPTSLFMIVAQLMASGAFIVGAFAFSLASRIAAPFGVEAWRMTFLLIALPGLIIAPVWLMTVSEPARVVDLGVKSNASIADAAAYFWKGKSFYGLLYLGLAFSAIGYNAYYGWFVTMLVRSYSLELARSGSYFGTVGLVAAAAAAVCWPSVSAFIVRRRVPDLLIPVLAAAVCVGQLSMASVASVSSVRSVLILAGAMTFFITASGLLPALAIQAATPGRFRGKMTALYIISSSLPGMVCGPPLAAMVAKVLFSGPDALRSSLSLLGLICGPLAGGIILLSRHGYGRALEVAAGAGEAPTRVRPF